MIHRYLMFVDINVDPLQQNDILQVFSKSIPIQK